MKDDINDILKNMDIDLLGGVTAKIDLLLKKYFDQVGYSHSFINFTIIIPTLIISHIKHSKIEFSDDTIDDLLNLLSNIVKETIKLDEKGSTTQ